MKKSKETIECKIEDSEVDAKLKILRDRLTWLAEDAKVKGVSRNSQATAMGFSQGNLSKYIPSSPDRTATKMSVETLIRICEYYNVSSDYLLGFCSDKKLMRRYDENDVMLKQMIDYTGLSRKAIAALHNKKCDPLYTNVLSFLLESDRKGALLDRIVEYILTALFDDLARDERYKPLPGANRDSMSEGKKLFADTLELLPLYKRRYHDEYLREESIRKNAVKEMAIRSLDSEEVYLSMQHDQGPYPGFEFNPSMSFDELERMYAAAEEEYVNRYVLQEGYSDITEEDEASPEYQQFIDRVASEKAKEREEEEKYDRLARAFFEECHRRKKK